MVYSEGIPRKTASASKLFQSSVEHWSNTKAKNLLKPGQPFIKRRTFFRTVAKN